MSTYDRPSRTEFAEHGIAKTCPSKTGDVFAAGAGQIERGRRGWHGFPENSPRSGRAPRPSGLPRRHRTDPRDALLMVLGQGAGHFIRHDNTESAGVLSIIERSNTSATLRWRSDVPPTAPLIRCPFRTRGTGWRPLEGASVFDHSGKPRSGDGQSKGGQDSRKEPSFGWWRAVMQSPGCRRTSPAEVPPTGGEDDKPDRLHWSHPESRSEPSDPVHAPWRILISPPVRPRGWTTFAAKAPSSQILLITERAQLSTTRTPKRFLTWRPRRAPR